MEWKDGYVAEIEYVRSVQRGLGPSSLNFVLMMNGIAPVPLHQGFSYCELGCGQGESVNLLSACHPEGSFHAIDFNHTHIQNAREQARKAGLANVTFVEADFADLAELALPEFDFITLHGVYTWVSAEKRHHIVEFIRSRLKPGGVVYNGYNSLPGWSAHAPLRQLMASYADMQSGPLMERIDRSVEFVEQLKGLNVGYFQFNPLSGDFFEMIKSLPRNYLAHEFFNQNWTPFYHADVVHDFAGAELTFACSARFVDFKDSFRFPAPVVHLLKTITDPVMRETVKDFAVNQQFRADVFTRGRSRLTGSEQMKQLLAYRFALAVPREAATLEVRFPVGMQQLLPELYEPILRHFEKQPQSLEEMYLRIAGTGFGPTEVLEALVVLCAAEYVLPVVEPSPQAVAATQSYNRSILERAVTVPERQFLASPQLRSAMPLSWPHLLLLLCEVSQADDPVAFAWKHMQANGYKLPKDGSILQSEEENLAELRLISENFKSELLPILRKLGAV